jgi:hypothetical protein
VRLGSVGGPCGRGAQRARGHAFNRVPSRQGSGWHAPKLWSEILPVEGGPRVHVADEVPVQKRGAVGAGRRQRRRRRQVGGARGLAGVVAGRVGAAGAVGGARVAPRLAGRGRRERPVAARRGGGRGRRRGRGRGRGRAAPAARGAHGVGAAARARVAARVAHRAAAARRALGAARAAAAALGARPRLGTVAVGGWRRRVEHARLGGGPRQHPRARPRLAAADRQRRQPPGAPQAPGPLRGRSPRRRVRREQQQHHQQRRAAARHRGRPGAPAPGAGARAAA